MCAGLVINGLQALIWLTGDDCQWESWWLKIPFVVGGVAMLATWATSGCFRLARQFLCCGITCGCPDNGDIDDLMLPTCLNGTCCVSSTAGVIDTDSVIQVQKSMTHSQAMDAVLQPITAFLQPKTNKQKESSDSTEEADAMLDNDREEEEETDEQDDYSVELTFMDSACNSILPGAGIVTKDASRRGGFFKMVIPGVPNAQSLIKAVGHQIAVRDQKNRSDAAAAGGVVDKTTVVQGQIESATQATIAFIEQDVAPAEPQAEEMVRPRGRSSTLSSRGGTGKDSKKDRSARQRRKKGEDAPVKVVV
jgi:hypothetical protein